MSGFVAPQRWCGQSQPHTAHLWAESGGLYQSCAGHAVSINVSSIKFGSTCDCIHEVDQSVMYTSNPPQFRCVKCNRLVGQPIVRNTA